jgi:hypothetical protein
VCGTLGQYAARAECPCWVSFWFGEQGGGRGGGGGRRRRAEQERERRGGLLCSLLACFHSLLSSLSLTHTQNHHQQQHQQQHPTIIKHRARPGRIASSNRAAATHPNISLPQTPSPLSSAARPRPLHTTTMSSGTVERPSEPMLGVDEAKDITAFYHNTAYRVSLCFAIAPTVADGAADARALSLSAYPPRDRSPLLTLSPITHPHQTKTHKNRRAASPSTSRR